MTTEDTQTTPQYGGFQKGRVARVLNKNKLVINRGSNDGVRVGMRYLVYMLSEDEIIDPETNRSLGYLEIVRGTGVVTSVQVNMAIIESDKIDLRWDAIAYQRSLAAARAADERIKQAAPFDDPQVNDVVKYIGKI